MSLSVVSANGYKVSANGYKVSTNGYKINAYNADKLIIML
jgi:hypothetical protein